MGENAEDAIDGLTCSWCGVYFENSHGYPVLCRHCWAGADPRDAEEAGLQRAIEKEL